MIFNEDKFWSAVKRKSMSEVLEMVLEEAGESAAAEEAAKTTRMTDAAINRIKDAVGVKNAEESQPELTYADDVVEEPNEMIELEATVKQYIKAGKRKKAKKALKALLETGITGSEIDELKKEVKGMK